MKRQDKEAFKAFADRQHLGKYITAKHSHQRRQTDSFYYNKIVVHWNTQVYRNTMTSAQVYFIDIMKAVLKNYAFYIHCPFFWNLKYIYYVTIICMHISIAI